MSHLSKALHAQQTGRVRPHRVPWSVALDSTHTDPTRGHDVEFLIAATVQARYVLPAETMADPRRLAQAHKIARRQILDEVFGEFRDPILALRRAIWDQDYAGALAILEALEAQMLRDEAPE